MHKCRFKERFRSLVNISWKVSTNLLSYLRILRQEFSNCGSWPPGGSPTHLGQECTTQRWTGRCICRSMLVSKTSCFQVCSFWLGCLHLHICQKLQGFCSLTSSQITSMSLSQWVSSRYIIISYLFTPPFLQGAQDDLGRSDTRHFSGLATFSGRLDWKMVPDPRWPSGL